MPLPTSTSTSLTTLDSSPPPSASPTNPTSSQSAESSTDLESQRNPLPIPPPSLPSPPPSSSPSYRRSVLVPASTFPSSSPTPPHPLTSSPTNTSTFSPTPPSPPSPPSSSYNWTPTETRNSTTQMTIIIGIGLNNIESEVTIRAGYYNSTNSSDLIPVDMRNGQNMHAWIEFDGSNFEINITIAPTGIARPSWPLLTYRDPIIANYVSANMFVGFSRFENHLN